MTNTIQTGVAGESLKRYIERIEKLTIEKSDIQSEITDIFNRAKGEGFDVKVMREVLKIRKMDTAEREEQESLTDIYLHALGMITELGND